MKKRIYSSLLTLIFLLLLPFHAFNVFAETTVGGLITNDITWTKASSPYIVTDSVLVNSGVTLTIEAGVTVRFNAGKVLQINGGLIARGTATDKITFTANIQSPSIEYWNGIIFSFTTSSIPAIFDINNNYLSGSILEHCVIESVGGTSVSAALDLNDSIPFVNHCIIQNNNARGINIITTHSGGGIVILNSFIRNNSSTLNGAGINVNAPTHKPLIKYCEIINNSTTGTGGGVYIKEAGATISNNIIENNSAAIGAGLGAMAYGQGVYYPIIIFDNIINNNIATNYGGGIIVENGLITIEGNQIRNNSATNRGGGILSFKGKHRFINNKIEENISKNGSAIYVDGSNGFFQGTDTPSEFKYNLIQSNSASGSTLSATIYVDPISLIPIFNFNNIQNNSDSYDLVNNNNNITSNLDAKNNYWGTTNETDIKTRIFDWFDDPTKGIVEYLPFATSSIDTFGLTSLFASFAGGGIWKYDSDNWTQATPNSPESMATTGTTLYGSFPGAGIWQWNGSAWSQVTPNNPQLLVASRENLYGSFAGAGIWIYNGSTWTQVTPNTPELMVISGAPPYTTLYASFAGGGIWKWYGYTWEQVTPNTPELMVTLGAPRYAPLYGSFAGGGIWKYDGSTWTQATPNNPQLLVASGENLYGSFTGAGIWKWDGTNWTQTTPNNPQQMVASETNLYGSFTGGGIWKWDGATWKQVTPNTPASMVLGN